MTTVTESQYKQEKPWLHLTRGNVCRCYRYEYIICNSSYGKRPHISLHMYTFGGTNQKSIILLFVKCLPSDIASYVCFRCLPQGVPLLWSRNALTTKYSVSPSFLREVLDGISIKDWETQKILFNLNYLQPVLQDYKNSSQGNTQNKSLIQSAVVSYTQIIHDFGTCSHTSSTDIWGIRTSGQEQTAFSSFIKNFIKRTPGGELPACSLQVYPGMGSVPSPEM